MAKALRDVVADNYRRNMNVNTISADMQKKDPHKEANGSVLLNANETQEALDTVTELRYDLLINQVDEWLLEIGEKRFRSALRLDKQHEFVVFLTLPK